MPAGAQVLAGVADAWREQREEIEQARRSGSSPRLRGAASWSAPDGELDPAALDAAVAGAAARLRPRARRLLAARRSSRRVGDRVPARAAASARWRCTRCARWPAGGIYDQIGGGFSRYSVDARWIVPHFEKMLYDNALLARAYLHGWQVTGEPFFARVCTETLDWVLRELRQDGGRLRLRAGRRLRGRRGQVLRLDAGRGARRRSAPTAERGDRALRDRPRRATSRARTSRCARRGPRERSAELKARLLRGARAARAAGARRQAADGVERADDLRAGRRGRGARARRLPRRRRRRAPSSSCATCATRTAGCCAPTTAGGPSSPATSRTTPSCSRRCSRSTRRRSTRAGSPRRARSPTTILERFADPERGGFFSTAADHEALIARRKDLEDTPIPSGASSAAFGLLRLAAADRRAPLRGGGARRPAAAAHARAAAPGGVRAPAAGARLPPRAGARGGDRRAGRGAARARRARGLPPHVVLAGGERDGVPLLEGREPVDGRAAAYVCEHFTCRRPVTEPDELAALLA